MTFKRNIRLTTMLLSALSGGLLALLIIVLRWGEGRVQAPDRLTAHHLAPPDLALLNPVAPPTVDVAAIRDNAVFYAHRTFFQPPPPGQSTPVPDYEFAGSIGLPQGKKVAFVKKKSDKTNRTVHVGDDLDGWHVESIDAQRVVIVRDTQRVELKLPSESGIWVGPRHRYAICGSVRNANYWRWHGRAPPASSG